MFDSGISAKTLIDEIRNEADIAPDIEPESYIQWLNAVEQLLYSEVIQEQKKYNYVVDSSQINKTKDAPRIVCELPAPTGAARVRFEDLHAVFVGNTQLIKTTLTSGLLFPNSYYKKENQLGIHLGGDIEDIEDIKVIYIVRPVLKTETTYAALNVMVPPEFLELVKAKLRGEAYKVANEDGLAAKWLNDYNILLETFKAWLTAKQPMFGM